MASLIQWTWARASSGRWWKTGRPGVCSPWELRIVGHDWAIEQQQQVVTFEIYFGGRADGLAMEWGKEKSRGWIFRFLAWVIWRMVAPAHWDGETKAVFGGLSCVFEVLGLRCMLTANWSCPEGRWSFKSRIHRRDRGQKLWILHGELVFNTNSGANTRCFSWGVGFKESRQMSEEWALECFNISGWEMEEIRRKMEEIRRGMEEIRRVRSIGIKENSYSRSQLKKVSQEEGRIYCVKC